MSLEMFDIVLIEKLIGLNMIVILKFYHRPDVSERPCAKTSNVRQQLETFPIYRITPSLNKVHPATSATIRRRNAIDVAFRFLSGKVATEKELDHGPAPLLSRVLSGPKSCIYWVSCLKSHGVYLPLYFPAGHHLIPDHFNRIWLTNVSFVDPPF